MSVLKRKILCENNFSCLNGFFFTRITQDRVDKILDEWWHVKYLLCHVWNAHYLRPNRFPPMWVCFPSVVRFPDGPTFPVETLLPSQLLNADQLPFSNPCLLPTSTLAYSPPNSNPSHIIYHIHHYGTRWKHCSKDSWTSSLGCHEAEFFCQEMAAWACTWGDPDGAGPLLGTNKGCFAIPEYGY